MLRSMTGYGRGEAQNAGARIYIEIKSLNHKYFDIISRLPTGFLVFEDRIKALVQKKIKRGRISLSMDYENLDKKSGATYIDIQTAARYAKSLRALKNSLKLSGDITCRDIIAMPGVIICAPQAHSPTHLWPLVKKALAGATRQLLISKKQEGEMLRRHLLATGKKIEHSLHLINRHWSEHKKAYKDRLVSNIRTFTAQNKIYDPQRLEEEAAIFIRNSDISEELCRIDAHIRAFIKALHNDKEVGRQLDFIAQEISREANTVGAKANNIRMSREIIKIKSLVENIREQTQNVE